MKIKEKRVRYVRIRSGNLNVVKIGGDESYWFKSSKIKLMSGSRYLFSNGILSHTLGVPPVKLFLGSNPNFIFNSLNFN
jgi:hypothetical protein